MARQGRSTALSLDDFVISKAMTKQGCTALRRGALVKFKLWGPSAELKIQLFQTPTIHSI